MNENYGNDFITLEDDEGNEFELEHLGTFDFENAMYMAFLPTDMDEDDEEFGVIILKVIEENGEDILSSIDDEEELNRAYEYYMTSLFDDDEE